MHDLQKVNITDTRVTGIGEAYYNVMRKSLCLCVCVEILHLKRMLLNELKLSFSTKKSLRFNCPSGCTEREQQDHWSRNILKRKRIFPAVFSILSSPPKRVMINGSFCLEKIKRAIKRKTNTNESPDWPNDEPPQARDTRESIITKCDLQNCSSGVKRLINAIVNHLRKDTRCVGAYTRARSAIYRPCP